MNQIATREASITQVGIATGAGGSSIAPQNLGEVVRFAEVMCRADLALPKHLRGYAGAWMAVGLQAWGWQMSPFAVASKSYSVNGQIAYEAQLIAAVVNTRSGIKGRLKYHYSGEGDQLVCKVVGILDGEECEYETPPMGSINPKNSPLWKTDPKQQLGYYAARSWARRHCPEVILGVYDRDEAEQFRGPENAKDVTPTVMQRLQAQQQPQATSETREGFNQAHVTREMETLASDQGEAEFEENDDKPSAPPADDDAAASDSAPQAQDAAANPSAADTGGDEEAGATVPTEKAAHGEPSAPASDPVRQELKRECLDKFLTTASDVTKSPQDRREQIGKIKDAWKVELPHDQEFVKACLQTADKVAKGELNANAAMKYLEGLL